jgi:hypothetical protein
MWIDNIKMDLLEIGVSVVDWVGLARDRTQRLLWRDPIAGVRTHPVVIECVLVKETGNSLMMIKKRRKIDCRYWVSA